MAVNTLITIKDALTEFVDSHEQLQRIEFEADDHRAPKIESGNTFPVMFVAPVSVRVERAMNIHRLKIYIYERINDNRDDVYENANDTSLMLRDIRVWWNSSNDLSDINIVDDPTGEFLSDRELDNVIGYYAFFDFEIPSHGRCDVPVNITPTPPPTCDDATVEIKDTDNNILYTITAPSGDLLEQVISNSVVSLENSLGTTLDSVNVLAQGTGVLTAPNAAVTNSTGSYNESVPSGGSLELPDITFVVNVNGTLNQTLTLPSQENNTINITS